MFYTPSQVRRLEPQLEEDSILFQGFPYGLNTAVPAFQIQPKELSECINFKIRSAGRLETRKSLSKFTSSPITGNPVHIETSIINGSAVTIIASDNGNIYYLNGTVPTLIGTVSGVPYLFSSNNSCIICDGSYIKYIDTLTSIKAAYDAGTGGTQYDNYSGVDTLSLAVGNGTNVRVAVKFTSSNWDAGFTIPLTQVSLFMKKVGSPTGTFTAKLRSVTDTVLASLVCTQTAADISTLGEFVDFYFTSSDITTQMSPNTVYYLSIEYAGGSGSNYLSVQCSSTGPTTNPAYYYTSSWINDTGKYPIMRIHPGLPPKAKFGWVSKNRPWFAGDPTNPGWVWFGNLNFLDFSTPNGGGYIGAVDEGQNSFAVGGGEDLYGDMFIYGTEAQPYLAKLTGTSPTDFALPSILQRAWTTQRTLKNIGNDLWNGCSSGVDALSGVQQYGDMRTFSASDKVADKFYTYWDSTKAFAGYYPEDGQYWLCFADDSYTRILIGHTKQPYQVENGTLFPWSEYTVPFTLKAIGQSTSGFMLGGADGHMYIFDDMCLQDLGIQNINPSFRTSYVVMPFKSVDLIQAQVSTASLSGASMTMSIYKNGSQYTPVISKVINVAASDILTIDYCLFDINDWNSALDISLNPMFFDLNINVTRFMLEVNNIRTISYPVFFDACVLKFRKLRGL
jgi:hypothetical protein